MLFLTLFKEKKDCPIPWFNVVQDFPARCVVFYDLMVGVEFNFVVGIHYKRIIKKKK